MVFDAVTYQGVGAVAESAVRRPPVRNIGSLIASRIKSITYKIVTCRFLAWRSTLIDQATSTMIRYPTHSHYPHVITHP